MPFPSVEYLPFLPEGYDEGGAGGNGDEGVGVPPPGVRTILSKQKMILNKDQNLHNQLDEAAKNKWTKIVPESFRESGKH